MLIVDDFRMTWYKWEYFTIDEKGTLKATEHDKCENIAGSV
jgi:hypothetical protein